MVEENEMAPDSTFMSDKGEEIRLASFRGKKVVLYFYPKDDTPGCTKEACSFRDDYSQFTLKNVIVIGVSPDTGASHQKFRAKYSLPFHLLSDPDHEVAEAYGAWEERMVFGKIRDGILWSTFIIDEEGKITKIFRNVTPSGRATEVLEYL
ncbi:MAG: thioredoxin-dependent thiol peroxidase [Anaerolineales bacterium]